MKSFKRKTTYEKRWELRTKNWKFQNEISYDGIMQTEESNYNSWNPHILIKIAAIFWMANNSSEKCQLSIIQRRKCTIHYEWLPLAPWTVFCRIDLYIKWADRICIHSRKLKKTDFCHGKFRQKRRCKGHLRLGLYVNIKISPHE